MTPTPNTEAIPSEEVEAAAKLIWARVLTKRSWPWNEDSEAGEKVRNHYRQIAASALTAAYPLHDERLRAEVERPFGDHGVVLGEGPDGEVFSVAVDGDLFVAIEHLEAKLAAAEAERDEAIRAYNQDRWYVGDEPILRAKLAKATAVVEAAKRARDPHANNCPVKRFSLPGGAPCTCGWAKTLADYHAGPTETEESE